MPPKRNYRRKNRRRRYKKKRRGIFNKSPNTGYFYVKQKAIQDIDVPATTPGGVHTGLLTFKLSDLPQKTAWSTVFDQFRIVGVQCKFIATGNTAGSAFNNQQILYTSVDLDGGGLPVSEAEMIQRANVRSRVLTAGGNNPQIHKHYLRPRWANELYSGGVLPAYSLGNRASWLDMATAQDATHYGLIYQFATPSGLANPADYRIEKTFYVQFRKVQ